MVKKYIDFNTDKRKNAANSPRKGEMENLRKRVNVRLVNFARDYKKLSKPNFVSQEISSENFVVIHETKLVLTLDKAIYKGFSILDLSKLLMHEFDYNYIERKYNANLLFTSTDISVYEIEINDSYEHFYKDINTDSLAFEVETNGIYEALYKDKKLFDFSNYPKDSKLIDPVNKDVIGKMKDEFKEKITSEFVGLKSKTYALANVDNEENEKAKGINKSVVKNMKHKECIDALFNKK